MDPCYQAHIGERVVIQIKAIGCHMTWSELKHIDGSTLEKCRIAVHQEWQDDAERAQYLLNKNLQGFIAHALNEVDEAEECFKTVLSVDPSNIIALADMEFLYRERCLTDKSVSYLNRLAEILEHDSYRHRAQAYADRAYSIRFFEQDKRSFRYMPYIERAATLSRHCRCPEAVEWLFDYGLALYRNDVQMLYVRQLALKYGFTADEYFTHEQLERNFAKACQTFARVIKEGNSAKLSSLSYTFLGILLNNEPNHRSLQEVFHSDEDLACMTADECYTKALQICKNFYMVERRVGAEYAKLGRYKEAKNLLDQSLLHGGSNWFSYRHRGVMYIKMYEDDKYHFHHMDKSNLLEYAQNDLNCTLQFKTIHADYSDFGYIHQLKGEYQRAIDKYKLATRLEQDDYFDPLETYSRWAKCLEHLGGNTTAIESRKKRACVKLLNLHPSVTQSDFFSEDYEFFSTSPMQSYFRVLTDDEFWIDSCKQRLHHIDPPIKSSKQYEYDLYISYTERDRRWVMAFVKRLEENSVRCCIDVRDFTLGELNMKNQQYSLKKSFKCAIILTDDYNKDISEDEINEAVLEGRGRRDTSFVIPIQLKRCTIPPLLATRTRVDCYKGQFPNDLWANLLRSITQN